MRIGEVEFVGLAFHMNSVAMVIQCCQFSLLYLVHQKGLSFFSVFFFLGHTVSMAHIYTHKFPRDQCKPAEIKCNEASPC